MSVPGSGVPVQIEQFKAAKIVPDVVKDVSAEFLDLRVLYKDVEVTNGLAMRLAQTQIRPHVELHSPSAGTGTDLYTLLMVDPDAPSPKNPKFRNFLHWVIVNIPGSTVPRSQEVWETGTEITPYMGPAPPEGPHRYVFLLYKQKRVLKTEKIEERPQFNVEEFAKLHELGYPLGGIYYIAAPNDELGHAGNQA